MSQFEERISSSSPPIHDDDSSSFNTPVLDPKMMMMIIPSGDQQGINNQQQSHDNLLLDDDDATAPNGITMPPQSSYPTPVLEEEMRPNRMPSKDHFIQRNCSLLIEFFKWFPVLFITGILFWGYYAYVIILCFCESYISFVISLY